MKKLLVLTIVAIGLAGCSQTANQQRVATGAAIGAVGGAAIGAIANGGKGAAIGAVAGAIGGAAVAGVTAPKECFAVDKYGRRVKAECPQ